jgi:hypothetical protein
MCERLSAAANARQPPSVKRSIREDAAHGITQ